MNLKFYKLDNEVVVSVNKHSQEEVVANSTNAAKEKHVPVITEEAGVYTVKVGEVLHPMTEEHLIEWALVETDNGYFVHNFKAGDKPEFSFKIDAKVVSVYAYCNVHGLWQVKC